MKKAYSLHIGLNYLDPNHYGGWDGKLIACENDARDMQAISNSLNYDSTILIREKANRKNVIEQITEYSKLLKGEDILYVSYSGHGGQVPDHNMDEEDALDETWCLYDGQLIDDELNFLWSLFDSGVRIFVTSDSCHSGTVIKMVDTMRQYNLSEVNYSAKNLPSEIANRTYYQHKEFYDTIIRDINTKENEIKASIILISGCKDNQFSYDGPFNGVFTAHLKKIWNGGKFKDDYSKFQKKITASIDNINQVPNLLTIGVNNPDFNKQRVFYI